MKRIAFFIALMVGLNANPVVRKPEEEENQAIVQTDDKSGRKKAASSIIGTITHQLVYYFYAVTKEGRKDIIDWNRIASLFKKENVDNKKDSDFKNYLSLADNKVTWLQINYQFDGDEPIIDLKIVNKKG